MNNTPCIIKKLFRRRRLTDDTEDEGRGGDRSFGWNRAFLVDASEVSQQHYVIAYNTFF